MSHDLPNGNMPDQFQSALRYLVTNTMHPIRQTPEKTGGVPRFVRTSSSFALQPKTIMFCADNFHDFPGMALNEIRALPPPLRRIRILGLIRRPSWTGTAECLRCAENEKREREKLEPPAGRETSGIKNSPAAADDVGPGGQRPAGLPGDGGGGGLPRRHAGGGKHHRSGMA